MSRIAAVAVKTDAPSDSVASSEYRFQKQRQEESKIVKGVFEYRELKGGRVQFPFKKYAGDNVEWYDLVDGQEYELPLAVVRHLNNLGVDKHSYLLDSRGLPLKSGQKEHRFSFKSSEYF